MKTLGICLGATTISIVEAISHSGDKSKQEFCGKSPSARLIFSRRHDGDPINVLLKALDNLTFSEYDAVAVTGRKLCNSLNLSVISEPEATEYALGFIKNKNKEISHFNALVSCGGETFMVYVLDKDAKITTAYTGTKCASGTGEFFLQQIRRVNIGVEEAVRIAVNKTPFKVSGRCSVFCKSDCTHSLNRGEPIGNVISGLCEMVSNKIVELLHNVPKNKIIVVGGVSQNLVVINFLKRYIPDIYIPQEACYFEALGAALWAIENKCKKINRQNIFRNQGPSFGFLPPLEEAKRLVSFKSLPIPEANPSDECVVGLDVGSTTTKAIALRLRDNAIIASAYLRTNGQPVEASRNSYRQLIEQLPLDISIVGLGVTGSGRQIAGLHALTKDVINEIIAHARAAVYFDKDVDTIFEIGGQDAKYTYLVEGVPCDYAMNEACSAGTGSFLEEACSEILNVTMEDIAAIALKNKLSPNFSDQCAAFISSDIKTAMHEGLSKEDIVAGLVYSICMNYVNRVKGARPVGKKIFMQGGVCYNKAVPLAMAALIDKHIIVPPYPGLMGAFGVALEVKERLNLGISRKEKFDLKILRGRTVEYRKSFVCPGSNDGCDRKCLIANIRIEGKNYPFGGSCNKYYNLCFNPRQGLEKKDLVIFRHKALFEVYSSDDNKGPAKRLKKSIGLNLSFLTYSFFPLYYNFFKNLGLKPVLPEKASQEGIKFQGAAFCYPAALAHGMFFDLIKNNPDYIFLPQVAEISVKNALSSEPEHQSTCFILQAEPYYLRTAFKNYFSTDKIVNPVLNFSKGIRAERKKFVRLAKSFGKSSKKASVVYSDACRIQDEFEARLKKQGLEFLEELEDNPREIGIVIFGRPYNAFCPDMNLGIPHKFTSRGIRVIPFDFLPYESCDYKGPAEFFGKNLTWAFGQMILKAASFVEQHKQLFGVYITNFSCGPDSFLLTYFRDIMKDKPSLTLEIDSHTADVGVNTRVEAFLDIVQRHRLIKKLNIHFHASLAKDFKPAEVLYENKKIKVLSSDNRIYSLFDPKVHLLIPSMGDLGTGALAALFNRLGIRTTAMGVGNNEILKYGRSYSSGKECLPLILTCGSLMKYLHTHKDKDEILVYFMPTVGGNCRFPQYSVFLKNLIRKHHLRNIALLSLTSENGYMGLNQGFTFLALKAVIISDAMDDIRNTLSVLSKDKGYALEVFKGEWRKLIDCLKSFNEPSIERQLVLSSRALKRIPLKCPIEEAKFVSLLGEIFIRKEIFSRQSVIDKLHKREIITKTAPVAEWLYYVDHLVKKGLVASNFNLKTRTEFLIKHYLQRFFERKIKSILSKSGLYPYSPIDIKNLIRHGQEFVPLELTGEPIIVVGAALSEILHSICGVISIGPFNCLPTRVTEAILSQEMNMERKAKFDTQKKEIFSSLSGLPFLSVEVDGNPLSPVTEARLDAFCLQAEKVHRLMQVQKKKGEGYAAR